MVTLASDWQELRTPSSSHTDSWPHPPACSGLCMLQAAPATPALPSTASTDGKVIRCPTSTAAPWVTCSSRKPHNDAIWEPGLLVQDAQPAYRPHKHLKSQGDWQWISTHETENLPRVLRGHSAFFLHVPHSTYSCNSSPPLRLGPFHGTGPPDWLSSSSFHSPHKRDLTDYPSETERHMKIYSHN